MRLPSGFIDVDPVHLRPTAEGSLSGLRFAAKDVMDVAGSVAGLGHPEWRRTHPPADGNADCIDELLAAGAELVGKTHTDEFTYSLAGQNVHYGTPPNPAVPGAVTGGSSSGSASVVAAGLVDFATGTDTGGSVRVPASFCGIYGIRPSHGAVNHRGIAHLAQTFDTVGWFARRCEILLAVGRILLPDHDHPPLRRLRMLSQGMATAAPTLRQQIQHLADSGALVLEESEPASSGPLEDYYRAFRPLQAFEAWACFGSWISAHEPTFGPGVKERFAAASKINAETAAMARAQCDRLRDRLRGLIGTDTVLCMPTTPTSAPPVDAGGDEVEKLRYRMLCMTAVAGIGDLPQVSLPLLHDGAGPVGLSLIGPAGSDLRLLELAVEISRRVTLSRP